MLAVQQIVECTLAQGALRHVHLPYFEQIENGSQHADASTNHGPTVFLEAFEAHTVGMLRAQQTLLKPVEPLCGDDPSGAASRSEHVAHGSGCPR